MDERNREGNESNYNAYEIPNDITEIEYIHDCKTVFSTLMHQIIDTLDIIHLDNMWQANQWSNSMHAISADDNDAKDCNFVQTWSVQLFKLSSQSCL